MWRAVFWWYLKVRYFDSVNSDPFKWEIGAVGIINKSNYYFFTTWGLELEQYWWLQGWWREHIGELHNYYGQTNVGMKKKWCTTSWK